MRSKGSARAAALLLTTVFSVGAMPPAAETTVTDLRGSFSLSYPAGWTAVVADDDFHSRIRLSGSDPFDVAVVIASRPLTTDESALEITDLLDHLVLSTIDNQSALGNDVLDAGRVDPLVAGWPAFSVIASDPERRSMITCWRFVADRRLYVVTTMTDNSQASPELSATVRRVVDSLRVHPRAESP